MPRTPSTLIIGAGPAGLTAAYHLSKQQFPVTVLESQPHAVGGISQTATYRGNRFDIGGHRFFSKSQEIRELWEEIIGQDQFLKVPRLSRILYNQRFYSYPLKPFEALKNLGPVNSLRIVASYAQARLAPTRPEDSFQDWVSNRFGKVLFGIFFKTYTEKVWGMDCSEISADWAAQRIQGLSLSRAVLGALFPRLHRDSVKTLTSSFHYPRLGPGQMWEVARDKVIAQGGTVQMAARVTAIEHRDGKAVSVSTRTPLGLQTHRNFDHLLSTMPLRELIQAMQPPAPEKVVQAANLLRYRDFLTVVLIIKDPNLFPDNWIYIHEPSVRVGRIQNYRNWSQELVKDPERMTTLGLEYFCNEGDDLWERDEASLLRLAKQEIVQLGLAREEDIVDGTTVRMPKAYPVYDDIYKDQVAIIRTWLEAAAGNLTPIGRNGMHKYNNQDHSMMTALVAAKNIVGLGEPLDVWKVHTDASYDEAGSEEDAGRTVPLPLSHKNIR